jgi:hypothetical protein
MRLVHARSLLLALASLGAAPGCSSSVQASTSDPGFAVVELFTSEGCSSCPRADDVLRDVADEATRDGRPVYTLAFHVDYWDRTGWRDPYSASWATEHQRAYVSALSAQGLYTPQMVVNGREELIGSHAAHARALIARERSQHRSQQLRLRAERNPERVVAHFELSSAAPDSVVRVALVDAESTTDVLTGENAGRRLRHVHVVRAFHSTPAAKSGDIAIEWPSDLASDHREKAFVVAYVQKRATLEITSAARAALK